MPTSLSALAFVLFQSVFRCTGADGEPLFTDRPCAGGVEQRVRSANVVAGAELTAEERATLATLGRERGRTAPREAAGRSSVADRAEACRTAVAALAELRNVRRRGYRVGEAMALDARERALEAERESACGRAP
jgi:hypothetical protein